jgi:hypothetical protein
LEGGGDGQPFLPIPIQGSPAASQSAQLKGVRLGHDFKAYPDRQRMRFVSALAIRP